MADTVITDLGVVFLEIGAVLFISLLAAYLFRKVGIPAILGLLVGGIFIGILSNARGYFFSTDFDSFRVIITEIAIGFIAYDIGNEIDLRYWRSKARKYGILLISSFLTFLLVTTVLFIAFGLDLWFAMIFGAIAMTTAPTVTSDILGDYHATGALSQAILFILVLDAVLAILLINIALAIMVSQGSGINLLIDIIVSIGQKIIFSLIFSLAAAFVLLILLERESLEEKSIVEWILGLSLIIIGGSLVFNGSVILSMLIFGVLLRTMEEKHQIITKHVLQLEILLIPIVLLFYVLLGLEIDLELLIETGLLITIVYFLFRFIGKTFITLYMCRISDLQPDVSKNLHLCLVSQAGIALSLTGLAYNQMITYAETLVDQTRLVDQAQLLITVIGISIIFSQLIGPVMLRYGIERCKSDQTKFTLLSAVEEPLIEI